jgi:hypothetical protein
MLRQRYLTQVDVDLVFNRFYKKKEQYVKSKILAGDICFAGASM